MYSLKDPLLKGVFFVVVILGFPRDSWTPKEQHRIFLDNSPFKTSKNLTKKERRAAGLPPNTYNERVYELTMNPRLGYPTTEKLQAVQQSLQSKRNRKSADELTARAPGETVSNSWNSLGPNNVGGRTRTALFDLSDPEKDKLFAAGVSGGIWVNPDIENSSEVSWSKVNGVPGNLAVTVIVQDKNEHSLLFAGTGESYTTGDAIGNGIYRSTDGGQNWSMVLGTGTSSASTSSATSGSPPNTTFYVEGNFFINDMEFWDPTPMNTVNDDEIIFAALGAAYNSNYSGDNTDTFMGRTTYGLYKSTDKGINWTRINTLTSSSGSQLDDINDIEIAADNTLWLSTTNNIYGHESGRMYSSTDGSNFTLHNPTFSGFSDKSYIGRVEIEPSGQNSATFYVLINNRSNNQAEIYKTTDAFTSLTKLAEPNDEHSDIPANDFTRGQAFYDLEVEVDPSNDNIVYVGGIDWHVSTDGGSTWDQMTRWNSSLIRNYSVVHADQHGLYFRPGNNNQAVVVNDGGVAFVSNLASATTQDVFTTQEKDFITTQFYSVAQTPEGYATDFVTGGTQDNGSHRIANPNNTPANSNEISGGDGGYTYIDQVSPTYYITNYIYNNILYKFDITTNASSFLHSSNSGDSDYNEGDFINPGALDSNLDILYTNATKSGNVRIRRFKDIDTSSPSNDYMPTLSALDESPSVFEVSAYTTTSTLLLVGLDSGKLVQIANAEGSAPVASTLADHLGSISDVQFGDHEDEIYLTYYNYGVNNVYYTSDGGANWLQKDGNLPDIPVWAIQHNPFDENEVIIATGLGIWQTDNFLDSSPNWTQSYNGMSDVAVHDLQFRGSSALSNRVIAGSYGRGIFAGTFQDAVPPTISLSSTDSDTVVSYSDLVTITATFSEAMAATPTLSISGLITNTAMSGSNTTWTYLWNVGSTSPTNGSYTATVAGSDLAGNAYTGNDSLTFTVSNSMADTTPPTLSLSSTDSDTIVSNADMVTITATFSEAMAATPTLSISGLITNTAMSGSNTTWTYLWNVGSTSPTNGSYTATVAGSDLAGNAYTGNDSLTFTVSNTALDTTAPSVIGPTSGTHSDLNMAENYLHVGSFVANETVNWSLVGIDRNAFQINSLGYLSFSGPKDFENPTDNNTDNRYEVVVLATDGASNAGSHSVSVTVIDVDEQVQDTDPPLITGPSGQLGASIAFTSNENISNLGVFQANEAVSWSLTGTDAGEFSITASGTLLFNSAPDFENPTDADGNNIYLLTVRATDAANNSNNMNVTLTVNDVNELSFNQVPGSGRYVYGILNPAFTAFNNPTSSQYMGTDPISGTFMQRNTSMGSFNNQTIIVRNANIDLGSMYDQNVLKSPGQQMRYTGTVRTTATGTSVLVSGVVQGIQVYQVPPMGYLFHFKIDVIPDTPFGNPPSASTQWATGILQFYISY